MRSKRTVTCRICGNTFVTLAINHKYCVNCTETARCRKMKEWRTINKSKTRVASKPNTIAEISTKAIEEGISYGQYVAKYGL